MASYVIGDVHGCYQTLMALLNKIDFNETKDTLYFVGDLVGRGPMPRHVVNFVAQTPSAHTVYGNHDLWAMAIAYDCQQAVNDTSLLQLFDDAQGKALLDNWRLKSKMMLLDKVNNIAIVHAGFPPCWSLSQAFEQAQWIETQLHGDQFAKLLSQMEGDTPHCWNESLDDAGRARYIINAFTRMRFCDEKGCLDFREKNSATSQFAHLKPWFEWPIDCERYQLFYGHWAALQGHCDANNIIATDTGCVYGGTLSAFRLDQNQTVAHYQVGCIDI